MAEQSIGRRLALHTRIRLAMRVWTNWLQFGRYAVVGLIGYAISIGTFAILYHAAGASAWVAATAAFCLALANNFL